ncbi:hypothetical protein C8Q74DRAFT_1292829 [Fomes fomentarius]|nr:hypothetical protein C8Q74DRAFT_1292829 [Fomes fomentarius]
MKFTLSALVAAAALAGVHAQSTSDTASSALPTDISGISPCILQCITTAAGAAGCSGLTDVTCFCTNTDFQNQTLSCLQKSCTDADVKASQALQQQQCGAVSGNSTASTASGGANSTATATGTDASTASNTAPAGETSNAALNLNAGFSVAGLVGSGVALLGAVAGAALVL